MGEIIAKLFGRRDKVLRILMVGLDAVGKTTLLYKLKLGAAVITIPTIGFNVETVDFKKISFTIWDIAGQDKVRPLWRHYYHDAQAVIFVVDCNDRERIEEAHDVLMRMLSEDDLRDAILLVYANKQDLPDAMKPAEVEARLHLDTLENRKWFVQPTSAISGDGLYEGMEWIASHFRPAKK